MLLLTNLYFLISLLPYCITFVLFKGQKAENTLGQSLVHILLYTNNAVNFLLYGFSSQKYREELCKTFFGKQKNILPNKDSVQMSNFIENDIKQACELNNFKLNRDYKIIAQNSNLKVDVPKIVINSCTNSNLNIKNDSEN